MTLTIGDLVNPEVAKEHVDVDRHAVPPLCRASHRTGRHGWKVHNLTEDGGVKEVIIIIIVY